MNISKRFFPLAAAIGVFAISWLASQSPGMREERKRKRVRAGTVLTRYVDKKGVSIDPEKVPSGLRDLIPLAKRWAITDYVERNEFKKSVSADERGRFEGEVMPRFGEITWYLDGEKLKDPYPHEAMLFFLMVVAASDTPPNTIFPWTPRNPR